MSEPTTIRMVSPHGDVYDVPVDEVQEHRTAGFSNESDAQAHARLDKEYVAERHAGLGHTIAAGVQSGLSAGSLGLYDVAMRGLGGDGYTQYRKELAEAKPGATLAGSIVGGLAIPTGGIGALAKGGEATTAIGSVVRAGRGAAAEGVVMGVGSGVSELALSDKPIDLERVISTISSHALYGGGIGGAAGSLGKVAEIGLAKAKGAIDDFVTKRSASNVTDDLAQMDAKQLKAAREVEIESLRTSHKAEVEAIEASRVTERSAIADDIAALRREVKDTEQWATTKGLKMPASAEGRMSAAELGAIGKKSDNALMRLSENPIGLAKDPRKALDALQRQEHGLTKLLEHGDELRAAYAADGLGGKRLAALEAAPALLEKNRALQARIAKASEAIPAAPLASPRIEAIDAARDALMTGGPANPLASVPQRMVEGTAFGTVTGAIGALPIPGAAMAAPLIGAAVSKLIGEKVFGRLGKAASEQAIRTGKAVSAFLEPAQRATKATVPVATKVLSSVRFAAEREKSENIAKSTRLADVFHERAAEVRSQTAYDPTGKPVMREDARAEVADRLKGVAAMAPHVADQLETMAARRIEFLASKLPRRPDIGGIPIGPDKWQPSDMEMRKWARYVAGVEDPAGIEDRLAAGTISVEDAEVMRDVYPERLAELTRQIVDQLPTLRVMLPYQKRLALSVLTGVPVVAAMDPKILGVLQGSYKAEPEPPIAKPNFGSVSKSTPEPTPAQQRSA